MKDIYKNFSSDNWFKECLETSKIMQPKDRAYYLNGLEAGLEKRYDISPRQMRIFSYLIHKGIKKALDEM